MTREHTRLVQLCPVTGEWFRVSRLSFPKDEPIPDDWTQLVIRERIVAWGIQERWSSDRFDVENETLEGTEATAVVATGSTYTLIPDMLEADADINDQVIGYFTKEDLAAPDVIDLITRVAKERIELDRLPRNKTQRSVSTSS